MADKIRTILVDDEDRATSALKKLLELSCPEIEIVATCRSVPEAVLSINKFKPHLVFLDIEMPEYNGFELFGFFREIDFSVIFVSAYSEFAINAFEVAAMDYLLKPVDISLLKGAVDKVKEKVKSNSVYERLELLQQAFKGESLTKIALPMADGLTFVSLTDIVYFEADGAYTKLFKVDGSRILISKKLKFFETALINSIHFFRSHRSFILNIQRIKKYNKGVHEVIMDNGSVVPVARDKKQEFESCLKDIHHTI